MKVYTVTRRKVGDDKSNEVVASGGWWSEALDSALEDIAEMTNQEDVEALEVLFDAATDAVYNGDYLTMRGFVRVSKDLKVYFTKHSISVVDGGKGLIWKVERSTT